jgi:hypothetical protein
MREPQPLTTLRASKASRGGNFTFRRGLYPKVKQPGREADHTSPTSAEVRNVLVYISTPLYVFMAE